MRASPDATASRQAEAGVQRKSHQGQWSAFANHSVGYTCHEILLGTLGCTPAYDRLVVEGIKHIHKFKPQFDRTSYLGFVNFYQENAERFKAAQSAIAQSDIEGQGMTHPVMKLVDMHFWNLGYQLRPPKTKKSSEARKGGTRGGESR